MDRTDVNCLVISDFSGQTRLLDATSDSMLLKWQLIQPVASCRAVSTPSVRYIVHYRQTNGLGATFPSIICGQSDTSECRTQVSALPSQNIVRFIAIWRSISVFVTCMAAWFSGNALVVALRRARLVLEWVTVRGYTILVFNQSHPALFSLAIHPWVG